MKRPWNRFDLPVYSLATSDGSKTNMNVCTYVTAISMAPKMYGVAVYQGTKTLDNLNDSNICILQLLSAKHLPLISTLGRKTGKSFDKQHYLERTGMIEEWKGMQTLKHCTARMLLTKEKSVVTGDHVLFIFKLVAYQSSTRKPLMLDHLRNRRLVRN